MTYIVSDGVLYSTRALTHFTAMLCFIPGLAYDSPENGFVVSQFAESSRGELLKVTFRAISLCLFSVTLKMNITACLLTTSLLFANHPDSRTLKGSPLWQTVIGSWTSKSCTDRRRHFYVSCGVPFSLCS